MTQTKKTIIVFALIIVATYGMSFCLHKAISLHQWWPWIAHAIVIYAVCVAIGITCIIKGEGR